MTVELDSGMMDNTIIGKGKVGSHEFMMHDYKITMCPRTESHVWEKCLYAHKGERARRRHPSKYQAVQCPEARAKKACPRGEDCNCTHHLFEYWLHPDRYMTCLCELGPACNRPICFFAHHQSELRPLPSDLTHPDEDTFPARRREQQQRSGNPSSPGSSNAPLAFGTNGPSCRRDSGGNTFVSVPGATVVGSTSVAVLNRPDLAGLSDAFGALELLSPLDPAAAAGTSAAGVGGASNLGNAAAAGAGYVPIVATAGQPAMQQRLSVGCDTARPSSKLQFALLEASQMQSASSAPSLASSSSYTLLTHQQQQLGNAQQQQQLVLLGTVSRQGSMGGQSACMGNSSTMLPVLTGIRAASSGLEVPLIPLHAGSDRLKLQAVKPSLYLQAGIAGSTISSGGYSPAAAQLQLQQQLAVQLRAQNSGLSAMSSISLPGSNCSSPLAFADPTPVALNPAALQMPNLPVTVGPTPAPQVFSSAMLNAGVALTQQQRQQQQMGSMPAVVFAPRGVQQIRGQVHAEQQLGGGVAYIQAAGLSVLQQQQQVMPVQVVDDQNEQLSFSMWAPDGTYLIPTQQQQQQPMPNYWQQQSLQQQQQPPVTLLSVNSNQTGGVGPEFQGWQQQHQQHRLLQQQQLTDFRTQSTWM